MMLGHQKTYWCTAQQNDLQWMDSTKWTSIISVQQLYTQTQGKLSRSIKIWPRTQMQKCATYGRQVLEKKLEEWPKGTTKQKCPGKNCIFAMDHAQIVIMHKEGRRPTYAWIVVDFRPQKEDPNRVRITAGGNLIQCPGELTTRTADLTKTKIVWNIDIRTEGARHACLDVSKFYLETPLERYEYMKMPLSLFPSWTRKQYNLDKTNAQWICILGNP